MRLNTSFIYLLGLRAALGLNAGCLLPQHVPFYPHDAVQPEHSAREKEAMGRRAVTDLFQVLDIYEELWGDGTGCS